MKFARSKGRYALIGWLFVSCAMPACSGDDNNGGAGGGVNMGSGGTAGTGGSILRDGATDARDASPGTGGADASPDRADGRAEGGGDARPDATGGAGGADTGADRGAGGAGGAGGSGGDASPDTSSGGSAGTGGAGGSDAAPDVAVDMGTTPDVAPPGNDVADSGTVDVNETSLVDQRPDITPGSDASDVTTTPDVTDASPPPGDADHTACTAIPGGASILYRFDMAAEAADWHFDSFPLGVAQYPPPNASNPVFNNNDGCPVAGQLQFTIPFDMYAGLADDAGQHHPQGANFSNTFQGASPDWTNFTIMHMRLKVITPGGLEFIEPYVQLRDQGFRADDGSTTSTAAILGVGVWHELVVHFTTGLGAGPFVASNIGIQIYATSPGDVVFAIDSIWVD